MTRVPKFKSLSEEREYWDTHDVTDVWPSDKWERNAPGTGGPTVTFAIRLDEHAITLLREVAQVRGLGPTQLARAWILERLRLEHQAGLMDGSMDNAERGLRKAAVDAMLSRAREIIQAVLDEAVQSTGSKKTKKSAGDRVSSKGRSAKGKRGSA